jgi:putative glutamine amidotransferase
MSQTAPSLPIVAVTATSGQVRKSDRVFVNSAYTNALASAGLIPLVIPPLRPDLAPRILDAVSGLVLTGGEDVDPARFGADRHPATGTANHPRDACELALAREAAARQLPVLAICRGIQILNVALGGSLIQDLPTEVGRSVDHDPASPRSSRVHPVSVDPDSRLARILNAQAISTNSFHHQAVSRLAGGLRAVASSPDGVVEAVESIDPGWWMIGVQWHPEELTSTEEPWDRLLFDAFAAAVARP